MFSPCRVQLTGHPRACLRGSAMPIQHRVRDVDDVGAGLVAQPVDELVELLALVPVRALEHRHRQPAELPGVGLHAARDEPQQPRRLPEPVEQPRGPAEQGDVLLQVDADAAEEDALLADVLLVGPGRRVEGQEGDLVPAAGEGRRQCVVADAASAVHAARPGRDAGDSHVSSVLAGKPAFPPAALPSMQPPTPTEAADANCRPDAGAAGLLPLNAPGTPRGPPSAEHPSASPGRGPRPARPPRSRRGRQGQSAAIQYRNCRPRR